MNEIKFIDLFGGIGGFRYGLEQASEIHREWISTNSKSIKGQRKSVHSTFNCVWYCEKDKYAIQTYNKNFKEQWKPTDITKVDPADIPDFDMLCAGFPCQSFSIAGKRKGFQDTRGTMFFEICRLAKEKKPSILFLENVKGLLSADDGRCFGTILSSLDELGYNVEWQVLNSKDFGVPQNRERVFIVGHLRGNGGQQIFPIRESNRTDEEISRKSKKKKLWVHDLCISQTIQTDGFGATIISHSPRTGNPKQGGTGMLTSDKYCFTIDSTPHYVDGVRCLTPVECERLQGFPDGWTEGVSDTQRYKQLGNAVTVNVIQAIGKKILEG